MGNLEIRQTQHLKPRLANRLIGGLKISSLMSMREDDYQKLIREVERSPLFRKLACTKRIIRYQRFPQTGISRNFLELKEWLHADSGGGDIAALAGRRKDAVDVIRRMGLEKFKKYFLYDDLEITPAQKARRCRITGGEAVRVKEFVDDFAIHEEFLKSPPGVLRPRGPALQADHHRRIASIENDGENFTIQYFCPSNARGRYSIDYAGLEEIKKKADFKRRERKKIGSLVKKLEMINSRKTIMHKIIETLTRVQSEYLKSGDRFKLIPFNQKELSQSIAVEPSLVCRALRAKSVLIPGGHEVALKGLVPSRKKIALDLLKEMAGDGNQFTDNEIRRSLNAKFGIRLSRRSVNQYRNDLKISSKGNS